MSHLFILGVWDGHDAGAALLQEDRIVFAVNEERLSRRKLDVGFPHLSIQACLNEAGIGPSDVSHIAVTTTDPAKTLTRVLPGLKEEYYLLRRRKKEPGSLDGFKKWFKYRFTELPPNGVSRLISRLWLSRALSDMGFRNAKIAVVDHHEAHAQAAARCSGFDECAVLTLDGLGDGLSGSIWSFGGGELKPVKMLPARVSLGIFFEHVTNLMNMRELEDEGKVMALANYAYPVSDQENPLLDLIRVGDLELASDYSSMAMFRKMKRVLWRYPSEQFAFMAQRALEKNVLELARQVAAAAGSRKLAVAGGVFSNVKVNMKIAGLSEVDRIFVFPHMGDGGLAIGAAMALNARLRSTHSYSLSDLYLGPGYVEEEILDALSKADYPWRKLENPAEEAARMILDGEIILWFSGRMEIGPRALGNRSILARPDDRSVKDRLNLLLKKRVWYQPFCPSMLIEEAPHLLYVHEPSLVDNRFMTMAFKIREEFLGLMEGVMNIDGTCRPQFVGEESKRYRQLLLVLKQHLGRGVVLNTSFNVHGDPVVCTPADAIRTLSKTGIRYLFLEDYLVENNSAAS